jgi:hypothetical protein
MLAPSPLNRAAELGPSKFPWWQDWRGECVAIIASGPSAKKANIEALRDRIHVVVVNDCYKLCPWAEILYSCDANWWKVHDGAKKFTGLRITQDVQAIGRYPGLIKVDVEARGNDLLTDTPGYLGAGANSGFQLLNLVVQFGATGIALIGFDMNVERGEHWHGRHPHPLSNPMQSNCTRWLKAFEGAVPKLRSLGVQVVNCSAESALTIFPKMNIEGALARWRL